MTKVRWPQEFTRNTDWLYGHRERLRSQYPNKCVAVWDHVVIDSADELDELEARLHKMDERIRQTAAIEFVVAQASCMLL